MEKQFEILRANRALILKIIENLSIEQLNKIPEGFKNSIAWNVGHLVITQQALCYRLAGLPISVNEEMGERFGKGSTPHNDVTREEFEKIKEQLIILPGSFEEDYKAGIFTNYKSYTTSANVTLNSINDGIEFNNFHEGIHLGVIMTLKKLV